jgi:XTP/dITP diphosphohydrolase
MRRDLTSLVLATGNDGKIRELKQLFQALPIELKSLHDFPNVQDVEETGRTFRENAELKAVAFAQQTGELSLADDSGLEVEALAGAPGVYSARYAGKDTGYDVKIPKLLAMLDETGDLKRRARFVCVMAISDKQGRIVQTAEGICTGSIAHGPQGAGGFGYDPLFIPDGFEQTFAQLGDEAKQQISHRATAARLIIRYLLHFMVV